MIHEADIQHPDTTDERNDIRSCYRRLFSTPDGERVLEHLAKHNFLHSRADDPNQQLATHNEGRRFVVLNIFHLIAHDTDLPRKPWQMIIDFILRKPKK